MVGNVLEDGAADGRVDKEGGCVSVVVGLSVGKNDIVGEVIGFGVPSGDPDIENGMPEADERFGGVDGAFVMV